MKNKFKKINYDRYYKELLPHLKKEKNQKYFTIILTFTASIFFLIFAINPTLSTITKLRKEVADNKFVDQRLTLKIKNLSSLFQAYQALAEDLPIILDAVPEKAEAPTLIAQIQSIAKNNQVNISNLSISPIQLNNQTATSSSSFTFEVNANSTYPNVYSFMSDLSSMQRVVTIDSISMVKSSEANSNIQLNLKGTAYYKK
jgi:Tfp pilus assembly protein PilO